MASSQQPALLIKLRPTGPWRIGPDSGARDRVDRVYHSDTLYSAVTSAMAQLDRLEAWLAATAASEAGPAVRFTSCFPFQGDTLFIPPPRNLWPPAGASRLRFKSTRFVPLEMVRALVEEKPLAEERWIIDPASECLLRSDRAANGGPYRIAVRTAAAVDRVTHGAVDVHSVAVLEFGERAGLWTMAVFRDDAARAEWRGAVQAAFRLLADSGFGGERSNGFGHSQTPLFQDCRLPDFILRQPGASKTLAQAAMKPAVGKTLPLVAKSGPVVAEVEPVVAEVEPMVAEVEPVVAEVEPVVAEVEPVVAEVERVVAEVEPVVAEVEPVVAEVEPMVAEVEPMVVEVEPMVVEVEPMVVEVEPMVVEVEPVVVEVEPVVAEVEPVVAEAEPVVAEAESVVVETEPVVVEAEPVVAEVEPVVAEVEPVVAEVEPVVAEVEPVVAEAEPVVAEAEPVVVEVEPVVAEVEPVVAEAEPVEAATPAKPAEMQSAWWVLSLYSPAEADAIDWSGGSYSVVTRGGRIESKSQWGGEKRMVRMIAEGSVLRSVDAPAGTAPNVAPEDFAHPVYRAGFAVAIAIPWRVNV